MMFAQGLNELHIVIIVRGALGQFQTAEENHGQGIALVRHGYHHVKLMEVAGAFQTQ